MSSEWCRLDYVLMREHWHLWEIYQWFILARNFNARINSYLYPSQYNVKSCETQDLWVYTLYSIPALRPFELPSLGRAGHELPTSSPTMPPYLNTTVIAQACIGRS